jgi:hypothetical protein
MMNDASMVIARLSEAAEKIGADGRDLTAEERAELFSDDDEAKLKLYAAIARRKARDQNQGAA